MTREEKAKAIDALKLSAPIKAVTQEEFNTYIQTINQVMDWLEQEQKTGNWIDRNNVVECSECGGTNNWRTYYCPFCGARMESEEV